MRVGSDLKAMLKPPHPYMKGIHIQMLTDLWED